MNRSARFLVVLAVLASLAGVGCDKLKARDQLNKGVQSYRGAQYDAAIEHFKNAVALDPSLSNARLFLATAYAQQCVSPDNMKYCNQAIDEFKTLLQKDPNDIGSLKGIASLYYNMSGWVTGNSPEDTQKKLNLLDESKQYHDRVIKADPSDPEAYYSVAVIDWTEAYKHRIDAMAANGQNATGDAPFKDKKVCEQVKQENDPLVQQGIDYLNKAIDLRKDYDDAMAYLNLVYRQKAYIECGDQEAYKQDLATADDWVTKTMATKRAKAEKQQGPGGIVLEQPKQQGSTQ